MLQCNGGPSGESSVGVASVCMAHGKPPEPPIKTNLTKTSKQEIPVRPAVQIRLNEPMTFPDGIRWRDGCLYVAEKGERALTRRPAHGDRKLIDTSLDWPSLLVFARGDIWIAEGQVLRLQAGESPNLPFKLVRRPAST